MLFTQAVSHFCYYFVVALQFVNYLHCCFYFFSAVCSYINIQQVQEIIRITLGLIKIQYLPWEILFKYIILMEWFLIRILDSWLAVSAQHTHYTLNSQTVVESYACTFKLTVWILCYSFLWNLIQSKPKE